MNFGTHFPKRKSEVELRAGDELRIGNAGVK